jgi:hypothetical protein
MEDGVIIASPFDIWELSMIGSYQWKWKTQYAKGQHLRLEDESKLE